MDISSDEGEKKKERSWSCSDDEESKNISEKVNV